MNMEVLKRVPKSLDLDPPNMLIEEFLWKQKALGNSNLDMDMGMPELMTPSSNSIDKLLAPNVLVDPNSSRATVSFRDTATSPLVGNMSPNSNPSKGCEQEEESTISLASSSDLEEEEELLVPKRCLRSTSLGGCMQKRSRLADIHYVSLPQALLQQAINHRSGGMSSQLRSGPIRSSVGVGLLGKVEEEVVDVDEEDDEEMMEGDLPESFGRPEYGIWNVLEWVVFVVLMVALPCTFVVTRLKHRLLVGMVLWKWGLLAFLLFSGHLVSGWVVRIAVLLLERSFVMRKRVLYFVYALRRGVQNLLWFAFAVVEWRFMFNPKIESISPENLVVLNWVTKVLYCFLIAAIVWVVKIFGVKVVASSFHVSTYFDRIQESLFSQYVLERLSEPPVIDIDYTYDDDESKFRNEVDNFKKVGAKLPEYIVDLPKQVVAEQKLPTTKADKSGAIPSRTKFTKVDSMRVGKSGIIMAAKSGLLKSDKSSQQQDHENGEEVGIAINHLHQLNQHNVSAWHMKRLIKFVSNRGISILVTAINECATYNKQNGQQEDGEIQSEWQARLVARKIFKNVAKPSYKFIMADDLGRFLRLKEVLKVMPLFEGAMESGGKITKNSLKNFVVYVFRERRALALSLKDTKIAMKKLHKIINVVASVIITVIWLLVLGFANTHLLLLVTSQLVLVIFIFGNTGKTLFEAIVFLFVMHPFDVGDRCLIEDNQVVVEEMNILSTLFLKYDGEKIWYPNSVLATKRITNYYRTPDTGDIFNFSIHVSTPIEKITTLDEKIQRYLASKPNHWTSEMHLMVLEIEDMNTMKMQLMVNHTIDYHDLLERQIRRSNLIMEVKHIFEEIGMEYHLLPQDVRLVPLSP